LVPDMHEGDNYNLIFKQNGVRLLDLIEAGLPTVTDEPHQRVAWSRVRGSTTILRRVKLSVTLCYAKAGRAMNGNRHSDYLILVIYFLRFLCVSKSLYMVVEAYAITPDRPAVAETDHIVKEVTFGSAL
jgi:hypothetical protein